MLLTSKDILKRYLVKQIREGDYRVANTQDCQIQAMKMDTVS